MSGPQTLKLPPKQPKLPSEQANDEQDLIQGQGSSKELRTRDQKETPLESTLVARTEQNIMATGTKLDGAVALNDDMEEDTKVAARPRGEEPRIARAHTSSRPSSLSEDSEEESKRKLEFNRKRNSIYSRRKYVRRKIEFEVLQNQTFGLRAQNHDLKRENQHLEALLADARRTVDLHEGLATHSSGAPQFSSLLGESSVSPLPRIPPGRASLTAVAGPALPLIPRTDMAFQQTFDPSLLAYLEERAPRGQQPAHLSSPLEDLSRWQEFHVQAALQARLRVGSLGQLGLGEPHSNLQLPNDLFGTGGAYGAATLPGFDIGTQLAVAQAMRQQQANTLTGALMGELYGQPQYANDVMPGSIARGDTGLSGLNRSLQAAQPALPFATGGGAATYPIYGNLLGRAILPPSYLSGVAQAPPSNRQSEVPSQETLSLMDYLIRHVPATSAASVLSSRLSLSNREPSGLTPPDQDPSQLR
jgi:hypothetical protein